jgi:hypothetical protein
MLSLVRRPRDGFGPEEMELLAVLGRLVATAAQNIHAYDAERRTVDELRRLSRSGVDSPRCLVRAAQPDGRVIGSARTLQQALAGACPSTATRSSR